MSKRIFKYPLQWSDDFEIEIPLGAELLLVDLDPKVEKPAMWCQIDTDAPMSTIRLAIFPTGFDTPEGWTWRKSFVEGIRVWHLHEHI